MWVLRKRLFQNVCQQLDLVKIDVIRSYANIIREKVAERFYTFKIIVKQIISALHHGTDIDANNLI